MVRNVDRNFRTYKAMDKGAESLNMACMLARMR